MSNSQLILITASLISGALIPVQAATNAAFSRAIGNPFVTAVVVFGIGLLAVLIYALAARVPVPGVSELKAAPFYGWLGGLVVAIYVIVITLVTPRIGVAPAIGLIITGQVLGAVVIDHFGLFGAAVRELDVRRVAGAVLMVLGIYLVMGKR